jgi:RNA polymerase primary sigma factor
MVEPGPNPLPTLQAPADRRATEAGDILSLYMREVGETRLITVAEEVELARRIKQGDGEARDRMIRANLRLVVKIARDYDGYGLPLLDLINEGNLGMMRAVDKFDPAKGGKLSTYSSWWIKQSIRRALANQVKMVRLPIHVLEKIGKLKRAVTKLTDQQGDEPSDAELAAELGLSIKRTVQLLNATVRISSLDAPLGDSESSRVGDIIQDEQAESPFDHLDQKSRISLLRELIDRLPSRERQILRMRFGLNSNKECSLEDIGMRLGVTRERIRQLQNVALKKLRKMMDQRESEPAPA